MSGITAPRSALSPGMQSRRMDEQRADLPVCDLDLPGFSGSKDFIQRLSVASDADGLPDDQFFDMLIRCQVRPTGGSRGRALGNREWVTAG